MTTISRFTIATAVFAVTAIACSSAPVADESASVEVQTDQLQTNCVRGGTTCGVLVTGGKAGGAYVPPGGGLVVADPTPPPPKVGSGVYIPPSGGVLAPPDPGGYPADSCGDCKRAADGVSCECPIGNGFDFAATVSCPSAHPCRRLVWGAYRCYDKLASGFCS